jgi:hypothetical protein
VSFLYKKKTKTLKGFVKGAEIISVQSEQGGILEPSTSY